MADYSKSIIHELASKEFYWPNYTGKATACEQDAEDDILYLRLDFQSGIAGKKLTRTMSVALVFSVLIIPHKLTTCTKISSFPRRPHIHSFEVINYSKLPNDNNYLMETMCSACALFSNSWGRHSFIWSVVAQDEKWSITKVIKTSSVKHLCSLKAVYLIVILTWCTVVSKQGPTLLAFREIN